MILANGIQYETSMQDELLRGREARLSATLVGPPLEIETMFPSGKSSIECGFPSICE